MDDNQKHFCTTKIESVNRMISFISVAVVFTLGMLVKILFWGSMNWNWYSIGICYFVVEFANWRSIKLLGLSSHSGLRSEMVLILQVFLMVVPTTILLIITWLKPSVIQPKRKAQKPIAPRKVTAKWNLAIGDAVTFTLQGDPTITGVVAKFNQKTVKIVNEQSDVYWNVPPEILKEIKPAAKLRQPLSKLHLVKG